MIRKAIPPQKRNTKEGIESENSAPAGTLFFSRFHPTHRDETINFLLLFMMINVERRQYFPGNVFLCRFIS